jgi:hypothetical protein
MAPSPAVSEGPRIATSDELLRAALERSATRNSLVARQRVRRRWMIWAVYKLLLFTLPLVLLAELAWVLWLRDHPLPPALHSRLPTHLQAMVNRISPASAPQAQSPSSAAPGASNTSGDL